MEGKESENPTTLEKAFSTLVPSSLLASEGLGELGLLETMSFRSECFFYLI